MNSPMLKKLYVVFGVLVLIMYGASGLLGWELRGSNKRSLQAAQSQPGGIRGFHFFHSGYRGGK